MNMLASYWPTLLLLLGVWFLGNYSRVARLPPGARRTGLFVLGWGCTAYTAVSVLSLVLLWSEITFFENTFLLTRLSPVQAVAALGGAVGCCWAARTQPIEKSTLLCLLSWYLLVNALHHLVTTHGRIVEYVGYSATDRQEERRITSFKRGVLCTCITSARSPEDAWMLDEQTDSAKVHAFWAEETFCVFDGIGPFFKLKRVSSFPPAPK